VNESASVLSAVAGCNGLEISYEAETLLKTQQIFFFKKGSATWSWLLNVDKHNTKKNCSLCCAFIVNSLSQ
jgi:hypothetical protein